LLLHSTRQRCQGRLQRATREVTRRESVYADFIMNASKSLLKDHISDEIKLDGEPQTLIGIAEEISAAAPPADRRVSPLRILSTYSAARAQRSVTFGPGEDAEFIRNAIHRYDLDIAAPLGLEGLAKRHPWLELGRIPAGRYDLERPTPSADRLVARVDTLVVANACALRAERVALLSLLSAQLPGFVRGNPPRSTNSITAIPLAPEARQFFVTGEPEIADRYFPWLVNLMSPVYWVYLVMAITVLFNAMRGYSRFRLWRIDAARERLKTLVNELISPEATRERAHSSGPLSAAADAWSTAPNIMTQLSELRARCQRYTCSLVTPMGDEMFYRYQESLINELMTALAAVATVAVPFELPASSSHARDQMRETERYTQPR
jgi:hypothetical protein